MWFSRQNWCYEIASMPDYSRPLASSLNPGIDPFKHVPVVSRLFSQARRYSGQQDLFGVFWRCLLAPGGKVFWGSW